MISKKTKKKKQLIKKGEIKFVSDEKAVSRPKDKIQKNIQLRRNAKAEHLFHEEERKSKPNNQVLKITGDRLQKQCKNKGCLIARRHGSAYCGECIYREDT